MASDVFGADTPDAEPASGHRRRGRMARILHRTSRRQRAVLAGGVVVVLVAAGVGIWLSEDSSAAPTPTSELVAAATSTLRQTVSSSGTIEPAQQANLNFATSGQVTSVSATVGEKVTAGKVLAKVSSASLSADVAQAEATEATDAAKLSSDQADGVTSAQLTADQTAVTAAENQVTDAKQSLAEANLTSPISGVVASVDLSVGQQVSGSGSSGSSGSAGSGGSGGSSTSVSVGGSGASSTGSSDSTGSSGSSSSSSAQVVVISTDSYVVNATVDDTEVGSVQAGDQAQIIPDGATTPVYGVVSSVGLIASTTSGVATYPVTIAVTGNPGGLYPGASATVTLIVKQLTNATTVPTAALHYTSSGAAVYEMVNGHQVAVPVTVGMTSDGETQITSGLSVGTKVVVQGLRAGGVGTTTGGTGRGTRGGFGGAGGGGFGGGGGGFGGAGGGFGGGGFGGA
jgi:multidrug efflux pump subunit AcrA (membrane-fusion protein)